MPTVEEVASSWSAGALVVVNTERDTFYRAAAFVFGDGDGLVWIEPHYLDPYGTATPAMHRAQAAQVHQFGTAFNILADGGTWSVTLADYIAEEDEDQIGEQIAFLFDRIAAAGTTWHAERERVRALVLGN
ncbi:MAG: hypothetical protein IV112_07550 [Methyloversatilis discipulorum]|uniref:hypothetical protein n=1 Tax=Methyloversatilis discipulorum TaxID=1119528 RepID=UPI0026F346BF|nr:hypothetical protein [Methyloversatilis discipulorum]MBT9516531.1 hypothetical protein [Methyloversatilis discipulorum]